MLVPSSTTVVLSVRCTVVSYSCPNSTAVSTAVEFTYLTGKCQLYGCTIIPLRRNSLVTLSFSQNVICSICGGRKSTCCLAKYYASIPLRVLFVPLARAYVVLITVVMSSISHAPPRTSFVNLGLSEDLIRHFMVMSSGILL